ncbi:hypothetical protein FB451DRAFT_46799 [Mycena latifolia]|nr:hypothetical protein FB451DRAFT_46799 [Mycena latifolia]
MISRGSRGSVPAQPGLCCPSHLIWRPTLGCSYSTIPQKGEELESDDKQALARFEEFTKQIPYLTPADDITAPHFYLTASYALIYEITRYLARHGDDSEAYLSVFASSEAPQNSDLDRARKCVFRLTETVSTFISTVPQSSPLRAKHAAIFDLLGALEPLYMIYSEDSDIQAWRDFWSRAQPVILELGVQLDKAGFGGE